MPPCLTQPLASLPASHIELKGLAVPLPGRKIAGDSQEPRLGACAGLALAECIRAQYSAANTGLGIAHRAVQHGADTRGTRDAGKALGRCIVVRVAPEFPIR